MRTYTDAGLSDYVKDRFHSKQFVRVAIIPFDVPETFAPPGNESLHFGREMARKFQGEFIRTGVLPIVELFNVDRWPGKREEFFEGNYQAMMFARDAGYDLVVVGYLEELRNDEELNVYTKIIDTGNYMTLWYGKTMVYSRDRTWRKVLAEARMFKDRPDLFNFAERTEELALCTVNRIVAGPLLVEQ